VTRRTKTEVREKLKKLQAEADAEWKTLASYTVSKAVDDWAAEALDGLADKAVRSHVEARGAAVPIDPSWTNVVDRSSGRHQMLVNGNPNCNRRRPVWKLG
jgi:hypothetical protein